MKSIMILIILIFISLNAYSFELLSKTDIALEAVYLGLHLIDWGQTLEIADNPEIYHEINPILGKHPSRRKVNIAFTLVSIGQITGTVLLPPRYELFGYAFNPRRIWQMSFISMSGTCVANNIRVGIRSSF